MGFNSCEATDGTDNRWMEWISLMFLVDLALIASLILSMAMNNVDVVIGSTVNYKLVRPVTAVLRYTVMIILLLRLDLRQMFLDGRWNELIGFVFGSAGCLFDLWKDLSYLLHFRIQRSYEVIAELPGKVFVVKGNLDEVTKLRNKRHNCSHPKLPQDITDVPKNVWDFDECRGVG